MGEQKGRDRDTAETKSGTMGEGTTEVKLKLCRKKK